MVEEHGTYRPNPAPRIQAFRWNGEPPAEWPAWARDNLLIRYEITNLQIDGIHGAVRVNVGDYVVRASDTDIYPCRSEVFIARWVPE